MLDEEEEKLRIGKIPIERRRQNALQRSAQAPEIPQLIGELVARQQRHQQGDLGPVAQIHRQAVVDPQRATRGGQAPPA